MMKSNLTYFVTGATMLKFKFRARTAMLFSAAAMALVVGCGDPIPMEEMGVAKVAIARAETVKSAKYSAQNFDGAQKALLEAHNLIEQGKMSDAKEKAVEAKKLADAAYDESAPKLAQETRGEAEVAIRSAEEANAEQFAADDLAASKASLVQGDKYYESKDYLSSYHLFEESREKANKALTTSEAQVEVMKRDLAEIDDTIAAAERAGAAQSAPDTLKKAKDAAGHARGDLENKKLKSAYAHIEAAKASSKEALSVAQKQSASEKLAQARKDVAGAERKLNDLKARASDAKTAKALEQSEEAQQALKTADENLVAAKEALNAAREAERNQAYGEVITQSEEASRLAKVLTDSLPETEVLLAQAKDRSAGEGAEGTDEESSEETVKPAKTEDSDRAGWKTYKVRYIPENRDCLWKIAGYKFIYNNARLWPKIYRANKSKIKNPDLIYPGQVFKIPPKKSKGD
jgi:nucleoid-associated protein YgaU